MTDIYPAPDYPHLAKFYNMVAGLDMTGRHEDLIKALETAWHVEAGRLDEHVRSQAAPQAGICRPFFDEDREDAARKLLELMGVRP